MLLSDKRIKLGGYEDDGFYQATINEYLDIVEVMLPHQQPSTVNQSLIRACKFGSIELVKLLLSFAGLERDAKGESKYLMLARRYQRQDVINLLSLL